MCGSEHNAWSWHNWLEAIRLVVTGIGVDAGITTGVEVDNVVGDEVGKACKWLMVVDGGSFDVLACIVPVKQQANLLNSV